MSNHYSEERKQAVLKLLLPPHNKGCREVARSEGISATTIYTWAKNQNMVGVMKKNQKTVDTWSAEARFTVLVETATLSEEALSAYCREKGLYVEQVKQWKANCIGSIADNPKLTIKDKEEQKADKKRIAKLERELARKEKALAEAAALLVLRKKLEAFYGEGGEED